MSRAGESPGAAIAEEKSVTAAASRLLLSQPAVSRALQRARTLFQDDLLVRSPAGFELTLRGRKILDELEGLLPKMERLVAPAAFDPVLEKSRFRISAARLDTGRPAYRGHALLHNESHHARGSEISVPVRRDPPKIMAHHAILVERASCPQRPHDSNYGGKADHASEADQHDVEIIA